MDTVPRRRRGAGSGEPELEAAVYEAEYQTAKLLPSGVGGRGEASPNTLEMGRGTGIVGSEQVPVANPFHSQRIHDEIQLINSRPATLDEDGQRIKGESPEGALGSATWNEAAGEPDYGAAFGILKSTPDVPRVARIESSAAGTVRSEEALHSGDEGWTSGLSGTGAAPRDASGLGTGPQVFSGTRAVPQETSEWFEEPELQQVSAGANGG